MTPKLCKYQCGVMLDGFDEEQRKYIEAGTGGLHTKERCQEAKTKLEQKNDHGNETVYDMAPPKQQYVDHTVKGQSKVKIFYSNIASDVEKAYNDFCAQKGIKGQGAHDHVTRGTDGGMLYSIFLYYEEVTA